MYYILIITLFVCSYDDTFIYSGAFIDAKDVDLRTPLMVALHFGHVSSALKLIERGACIEGIDSEGRNIVHLAAQHDSAVTVLEVRYA